MVKDKVVNMNFEANSSKGTTERQFFSGSVYLKMLHLNFEISKPLSSTEAPSKRIQR